jgi:PAS domain S-box-containing protein
VDAVNQKKLITEREKPQFTVQQLASIVESSDAAILGLDLEGTIAFWNQGANLLFGYTSDEMLGTSILRLIPEELHAVELQTLQRIGYGEKVDFRDTVRLKKGGDQLDVSVYVSPIKNAVGHIVGASAVNRDITDRKLVERNIFYANKDLENRIKERTEALVLSEERIRQATIAAGLGIWDWDLRSNRIVWDKLMFSIYGMPQTADGLINYQDWANSVHPKDLANEEASLRNLIEVAGRNQREFRIIRASDGATRNIRAAEAAILGEDGKPVRVVGINIDITESMEMVQSILDLNTSLKEQAVQLEASVAELDAFSYSVSHDLRAPLRTINSFSRIVEADYAPMLDEEGRRLLKVIREETQRMGKLIDDLLAFSRLGRMKIEGETVDMEAMARDVFGELAAAELGRTIHLKMKPIPPAFGTEPMLRQLWVNLISNALKFTGKREVAEIEVGILPEEQRNQHAQVYFIKDNGAGFDMRHADRLFGVFQRLHSKDEFPGTGVGLAIVKRIVQKHRGRLWGKGEVDKGATIFFTLAEPQKQQSNIQDPSILQAP